MVVTDGSGIGYTPPAGPLARSHFFGLWVGIVVQPRKSWAGNLGHGALYCHSVYSYYGPSGPDWWAARGIDNRGPLG